MVTFLQTPHLNGTTSYHTIINSSMPSKHELLSVADKDDGAYNDNGFSASGSRAAASRRRRLGPGDGICRSS